MYTQAGGQGSNIAIYYALPGETLDSSSKTVQGDEGIRELLRDYQGLNIISIYIEELSGPILAVDKHGNLLDTVVSVPQITYIDKRGEGVGNEGDEVVGEEQGEGARNEGGEVAGEEGGEGVGNEAPWVDWGDHGDTEWTEGGDAEVNTETKGGGDETGVNTETNDRQDEVRVSVEAEGGGNEAGSDEDESSNSDSSSLSDCPSWMLEDLEGPWDDDIFCSRPEGYTRTMLKTMRALLREKKKNRKIQKQARVEGGSRGTEPWFSDCEEEELKTVRGSDDEGDGYVVWDDRMDMNDVELAVGMKFETRVKFREVLRDWAVRRGWDLKFFNNEKHKITSTCKNECDWKLHASSIMKSTTFQIKSIKGRHTCAHRVENKQANFKYIGKKIEAIVRDNPNEGLQSLKNKIRRELQIDISTYKVYRAKKYALQ